MQQFEVVEVEVPFMFQLKDKKHYKVRNKKNGQLTLGSYTTLEAAQEVCLNKNKIVCGVDPNCGELRERFFE